MFDININSAATTAINSETEPQKQANGEEKMKNKRNPFPMIGKVYKYEFRNISRTVFPLFTGMILIGLVLGLFAPNITFFKKESLEQAINLYETNKITLEELTGSTPTDIIIDIEEVPDDSEYDLENPEIYFDTKLTKTLFSALLIIFLLCGFFTMAYVLLSIDKRIKKSFVEKEAYFRFTLPVTIGEHIAGSFLTYLTFSILWIIITLLSACLIGIKYYSIPLFKMINYFLYEVYVNGAGFPSLFSVFTIMPLSVLSVIIIFISFDFMEKTIEMVFRKKGRIFEYCIEIPLVIAYFIVMFRILNAALGNHAPFRYPFMLINLGLTIINIAITYFAYKKRINIE